MGEKLYIPGPDEPEDFTEVDIVIVYTWAVCMLLCIGLFFFLYDRQMAADEGERAAASASSGGDGPLEVPGGDFTSHAWSKENAAQAFERGPSEAAHYACEEFREELESGRLEREVHLSLLRAVDRRADHAPWACLVRLYLDDRLSDELELVDAVGQLWEDVERFEASDELIESMLQSYHRGAEPPASDRFDRWLGLCASYPRTDLQRGCFEAVVRLTPGRADDVLAMIDEYLEGRHNGPFGAEKQLEMAVEGLGKLARDGRLVDSKEEAGGAKERRSAQVGASFQLCRVVNSPDEEIAEHAARRLSDAARTGARAADENITARWRRACRLAFRDDEAVQGPSSRALAVWSGDKEDPPRYGIESATARGDCPEADSRTVERCALDLWHGTKERVYRDLRHFFVQTRHLEWRD